MSNIAHLSDVHFGHHDPEVVAGLEILLFDRRPDLVVISGDLTQRARVAQYELACEFIDRLEANGLAVLAVPGNHDVPLYDIVRRFTRPLARYKRYIDDDLCPWWENDELAVLGINTARSLTFKDGSVSHDQMRLIRECFNASRPGKLRILVTHHPLIAMPLGDEDAPTGVVNRSVDALTAAGDAGVDMLLAGHIHRSFSQSVRALGHLPGKLHGDRHVENTGRALVVQAGTATSTRLRGGERQSFNWIEADHDGIGLTVHGWDGAAFVPDGPVRFLFDGEHWHSASLETQRVNNKTGTG